MTITFPYGLTSDIYVIQTDRQHEVSIVMHEQSVKLDTNEDMASSSNEYIQQNNLTFDLEIQ